MRGEKEHGRGRNVLGCGVLSARVPLLPSLAVDPPRAPAWPRGEGLSRPGPAPGPAFSAGPRAPAEMAGTAATPAAPGQFSWGPRCAPRPGHVERGIDTLCHPGRVAHLCASGHLSIQWARQGAVTEGCCRERAMGPGVSAVGAAVDSARPAHGAVRTPFPWRLPGRTPTSRAW